MKIIVSYIIDYFRSVHKDMLAACSLFIAIMIFVNFRYGIDTTIDNYDSTAISFYYRYLIFLIAFAIPYFFYFVLQSKNYFKEPLFSLFIIIAPAIFSGKIAMNTNLALSSDYLWNHYWNQIIYWPLRLIALAAVLFIVWKKIYRTESFFGLTTKNFNWKPYLLMLLIMVPLITVASTQPDFLNTYPKIKDVNAALANVNNKWFYHLLHELAYGTDFISVELFFRGFLILAFIKIAGKDAILPMACYYCTIHFGKPLGECISSYFGGMILGIVVYHTRSIIGGLIVHLGIAWLMELGGYIGNSLFR